MAIKEDVFMNLYGYGQYYAVTDTIDASTLLPFFDSSVPSKTLIKYRPIKQRVVNLCGTPDDFSNTELEDYQPYFDNLPKEFIYIAPLRKEYAHQFYFVDKKHGIWLPLVPLHTKYLKKIKYEINKINYIRTRTSWAERLACAPRFAKIEVLKAWQQNLLEMADSFDIADRMDELFITFSHFLKEQHGLSYLPNKEDKASIKSIFKFLRKVYGDAYQNQIKSTLQRLRAMFVNEESIRVYTSIFFASAEEYEDFKENFRYPETTPMFIWQLTQSDCLSDNVGKMPIQRWIKATIKIEDILWLDVENEIPYVVAYVFSNEEVGI